MSRKILVIEDEKDIVELLRYNLTKAGYDVATALTGEDGLKQIKLLKPDLILLDLMLPGISGTEICKRVKSDPDLKDVSIVMVTAKGAEDDIVQGLETGADDYVTKPFSPTILMARVAAVLRRRKKTEPSKMETVQVRDLQINPRRHEVKVGDKTVDLTATEFGLLHFLARHRGWVFTRAQIVEAVKGTGYSVTDRAVDVQIVGLRKKLGEFGTQIETVRGVGYRFKE